MIRLPRWLRFAALSVMAVPAACAPALTRVPPDAITLRSYEIGQVQSVGIGDPIFDVQSARQQRAFQAVRSFTTPRAGLFAGAADIAAGDAVLLTGEIRSEGLLVLSGGSLPNPIAIDSSGIVRGWVGLNGQRVDGNWPDDQLFEPMQRVTADETAFRAQLIYSGVDGNTLNAVYREFAGDLIRPAFTQELQYDLSASSEIGYRSVRIDVVEASNATVRFRVLDDGGLEWLPR